MCIDIGQCRTQNEPLYDKWSPMDTGAMKYRPHICDLRWWIDGLLGYLCNTLDR